MEPFKNNNHLQNNSSMAPAPFVMKIYQMVNDPFTDGIINWGKANNSFIVNQPLDFSHRILPLYFKHNNFSSFVRQLNSYGFRKVDPDKYEFANEWFLRGQIQLLKNIVRRKNDVKNNCQAKIQGRDEESEENESIMEIAKLKEEQNEMDKELASMNKRIDSTERRPEQMMNFLSKVVEDPQILPRIMLEMKRRNKERLICKKKRRILISKTAEAEEQPTQLWSQCEVDYNCGGLGKSSSSSALGCQGGGSGFDLATPLVDGGYWYDNMGDGVCNYHGGVVIEEDTNPSPYPFSLFGGGFY